MCIDYHGLNAATVCNSYPIPQVDNLLDRLTHARIFSKLDLQSGYHQVAISLGNEPKSAFTTQFGLFEFTILPFGVMNAPSMF